MNKFNTKTMTRTAILLALTVVVQMVGRSMPAAANIFFVGPLVNACLLIATAYVGLPGGIIIAVLAPYTSLINNHAEVASILFYFAPFIIVGNCILVFCFNLLLKKNQVIGVILGAVLKFGFLFAAIQVFVKILVNVKPKMETNLLSLFSFPQLITALIGGAIAIALIRALKNKVQV